MKTGTGRDGPLNLDKSRGKWSWEVELREEKAELAWPGHFIEHLVCIGGELEHPNALPHWAAKNRALWSALLAGDGVYIGKSFVPVRGWKQD